MDLRPYQREGADFLSSGARARLLGDEPGLGKTRQAIHACDTLGVKRVLVLAPAVAKSHWQREFETLQALKRRVQVITSQRDIIPQGMPLAAILNFDMVHSPEQPLRRKLLEHEWDVLILDEIHALKTPSAKRTRFVYGRRLDGEGGLISRCRHVLGLSGTIMPNNAAELWPHLHALAPSLIPDPLRPGQPLSYQRFVDSYAVTRATPWGDKIVGSKNLPDLKRKLASFMLRRRKVDVLRDLPPLTFELYALTLDTLPPVTDPAFDQLDDTDLENVINQPGAISTVRRVLGEAKVEPTVQLVLSELNADPRGKVIVFAHHLSVLDALAEAFFGKIRTVRIDGRTSPAERDRAIEAFQGNPQARIFLGQIQAAGVAITLTASSNVLICEPSFVPSQNLQAAARAHRFGQRDAVLVRYLFVPNSLDERIIKILHRKTKDIAIVTNDDVINLGMPA
jgi:SWI/SNF-related matrix-associated actin-dependent regulator of chromatin subfamily A-like protein 1